MKVVAVILSICLLTLTGYLIYGVIVDVRKIIKRKKEKQLEDDKNNKKEN